MKQNIDLTENRMFSRDTIQRGFFNHIRNIMPNYHFWDYQHMTVVHSDRDLYEHRNALFICGTATERQYMINTAKMDCGLFCDCCGVDLTLKPWSKHYCLCADCSDWLERDVASNSGADKVPWAFQAETLRSSTDRIVREMNR